MIGLFGGVFLTSNPDMRGYDTKKNYIDGGGGLVYDFRHEWSENFSWEFIASGMIASCNTSHTEEGEDKIKVTFPLEIRFYGGADFLKFYLGGGLQYNFIWATKDTDEYGYDPYWGYYNTTDSEDKTSAHQLSGNVNVGLCLLGSKSPIHLLLGTKFHFPIINNAEGTGYSNGSRIDFSKDKTNVALTGSFSWNMSKRTVLMLNYDYALGKSSQTEVTTGESRNFFQQHTQSLTMNLMFVL